MDPGPPSDLRRGVSMAERPASELPSMVQDALKVIGHVSDFVKAMNELVEKHEDLRLRFARLEREHEEVRHREEAARREAEETAEALGELGLAYEALIIEHEVGTQAFQKLQEDHDGLLEGQRQIAEGLGAVMSSLRTGQRSVVLDASAADA